jgi:hypothetical protein
MVAMIVSLQRRLDQHFKGDRERQFFSHSLQHLSAVSGYHVKLEDWMITSFEVEFGPEIGAGGL